MTRRRATGRATAWVPALVAALAAMALGAGPARAGAWLQEPGTAYVRMAGGAMATQERFDQDGDRVQWDASGGGFRNARYEDISVYFYGEAGVHRGWNAVVSFDWKHLEADQPSATFTTYGFGDLYLGAKRDLVSGPRWVSSLYGGVLLPLGYDVEDYPSLGSDATDLVLGASLGTSGSLGWTNLDLEFRVRGSVYQNSLGGAWGGGAGVTRWLALRGELRGAFALGENSITGSDVRFDPATADPSNLDVAGTASFTVLRGVALEAEVRSTVWGENTLAGTRVSLAVATAPVLRWRR